MRFPFNVSEPNQITGSKEYIVFCESIKNVRDVFHKSIADISYNLEISYNNDPDLLGLAILSTEDHMMPYQEAVEQAEKCRVAGLFHRFEHKSVIVPPIFEKEHRLGID